VKNDDRDVQQMEEALEFGSWKPNDAPYFKVPNASHYIRGHIIEFFEIPLDEQRLAIVQFEMVSRVRLWVPVGALFRRIPKGSAGFPR